MTFKALKDFYSSVLQSHYLAGLFYTIRPSNMILAKEAAQWARDGWIEFTDTRPVGTIMSGQGKVISWQ